MATHTPTHTITHTHTHSVLSAIRAAVSMQMHRDVPPRSEFIYLDTETEEVSVVLRQLHPHPVLMFSPRPSFSTTTSDLI